MLDFLEIEVFCGMIKVIGWAGDGKYKIKLKTN